MHVADAAGVLHRLGRAELTAIGTGGGGTYLLDAPFRGNALTGDPLQWARLVAQAGSWPDLTLGGASFDWVGKALNECLRLSRLKSPVLPALGSLGGQEKVVSPAAIRERLARWPGARLLEIPDGRHEILMCTPDHRAAFLSAALSLFKGAAEA